MGNSTANNGRICGDCRGYCQKCFGCFTKTDYINISKIPDTSEPVTKALFIGDLPEKLQAGSVICVKGIVKPTCTRFSINLVCSRAPNRDVGFHFNPRFDQRCVVRNYKLNGKWGVEETTSFRNFVFKRSEKFFIDILITNDEFLVAVDGEHFCGYTFRIPLKKITNIEVIGDVDVSKVDFREITSYPDAVVRPNVPVIKLGDTTRPESKYPNPCMFKLERGFLEGYQIDILGKVKLLPHSFYVNLQQGPFYWPHPVIPLHLNPRFSTSQGAHAVVRNSWQNGAWGAEERAPGFQFCPGREFSLSIRCEDNQYSVWVDGKLTAVFPFRMETNLVDTIYIQGDVYIKQIICDNKFNETHFHRNT